MMWGYGLEDGNKHKRDNLPFTIAGKGGGTLKTGRFLPDSKGSKRASDPPITVGTICSRWKR